MEVSTLRTEIQLATTIDEVLVILDSIIEESKIHNNPLGYFAALYYKVTYQVKLGIERKEFDDNRRMEELDVIFANRYINAYYAFQVQKEVTKSWEFAFKLAQTKQITVLQHLLVGMNAHINLDLGIAAARVCQGQEIASLQHDFNKINQILSSLVEEVENDIASIWPLLKKILKWTAKVDDLMVDFSMKLARDGAWRFALRLHGTAVDEVDQVIQQRDTKVVKKASIVNSSNFIIRIIFRTIYRGEKGTVAEKISRMQD
jgi:hypothetical protein